jgi:hypothetical protein
MFYGQLMLQGYLSDPSLSFCAVDDSHDVAPLQVTDFGQGVQIDQLLSKVYLECGGNGEECQHEVYELSALFYLRHCQLTNAVLPFFFITGDEHFYSFIRSCTVKDILGYEPKEDKEYSIGVWKELMKKFNVFHLHKPFDDQMATKLEVADWLEALGPERILVIHSPKAVIDVVLGAIALTSGCRTLETYVKDMEIRGQTKERIKEVAHSLRRLTPKFIEEETVRFKEKEVGKEKKEEEKKEEDP